jgi:hypothetical protein
MVTGLATEAGQVHTTTGLATETGQVHTTTGLNSKENPITGLEKPDPALAEA